MIKPHEQRLVNEEDDLSDKWNKLNAFLKTVVFNELEMADQCLLRAQLSAMTAYLDILNMRIQRIPKEY